MRGNLEARLSASQPSNPARESGVPGHALPARPHLLRQPLPAAKPFSIHHIRAGLQLSIIVQLVRDVQDGGVRPRWQEEKARSKTS